MKKKMKEQKLRQIIREELEMMKTGSTSRPSRVSDDGPSLEPETTEFLEALANGVSDYLSDGKSFSVQHTNMSWNQVEYALWSEGTNVSYAVFITIKRQREDVYRLAVVADVGTAEKGQIDEHEEYIRFRSDDAPGPEDVSSGLVSRVANMVEDAKLEVSL